MNGANVFDFSEKTNKKMIDNPAAKISGGKSSLMLFMFINAYGINMRVSNKGSLKNCNVCFFSRM